MYFNDWGLMEARKRRVGVHGAVLEIPKQVLAPGSYFVSFGLWEPGRVPDHFPSARLAFRTGEPVTPLPDSVRLSAHDVSWPAVLYMPADWSYVDFPSKVAPEF